MSSRRGVVAIDDDFEWWSPEETSRIERARVSVNGRARDYVMVSEDDVVDVERWLCAEEELVRRVFDVLDDFLIRGRLVLRAWFIKRDPATAEVLRRELFYLSSLPANVIHDFHQWYHSHVRAIINNLDNFCNQDSALEFDNVEALDLKFNLLPNLSGRGFSNYLII